MTAAEILALGHRRYELSRCHAAAVELAENRAAFERSRATPWSRFDAETWALVGGLRVLIAMDNAKHGRVLREHRIDPGTTANDARNLVLELTAAVGASGE